MEGVYGLSAEHMAGEVLNAKVTQRPSKRTWARPSGDPGRAQASCLSAPTLIAAPSGIPTPGSVPVTVAVRAPEDDNDEDCSEQPSTPDRPRTSACRRDRFIAGNVRGTFHPDLYLSCQECITYKGKRIGRSKFEKLGNSSMAKWHRSIRVIREDRELEPLGEWLTRHGLPVLKGKQRVSRKRTARIPPLRLPMAAAAAAAAAGYGSFGSCGGSAAAAAQDSSSEDGSSREPHCSETEGCTATATAALGLETAAEQLHKAFSVAAQLAVAAAVVAPVAVGAFGIESSAVKVEEQPPVVSATVEVGQASASPMGAAVSDVDVGGDVVAPDSFQAEAPAAAATATCSPHGIEGFVTATSVLFPPVMSDTFGAGATSSGASEGVLHGSSGIAIGAEGFSVRNSQLQQPQPADLSPWATIGGLEGAGTWGPNGEHLGAFGSSCLMSSCHGGGDTEGNNKDVEVAGGSPILLDGFGDLWNDDVEDKNLDIASNAAMWVFLHDSQDFGSDADGIVSDLGPQIAAIEAVEVARDGAGDGRQQGLAATQTDWFDSRSAACRSERSTPLLPQPPQPQSFLSPFANARDGPYCCGWAGHESGGDYPSDPAAGGVDAPPLLSSNPGAGSLVAGYGDRALTADIFADAGGAPRAAPMPVRGALEAVQFPHVMSRQPSQPACRSAGSVQFDPQLQRTTSSVLHLALQGYDQNLNASCGMGAGPMGSPPCEPGPGSAAIRSNGSAENLTATVSSAGAVGWAATPAPCWCRNKDDGNMVAVSSQAATQIAPGSSGGGNRQAGQSVSKVVDVTGEDCCELSSSGGGVAASASCASGLSGSLPPLHHHHHHGPTTTTSPTTTTGAAAWQQHSSQMTAPPPWLTAPSSSHLGCVGASATTAIAAAAQFQEELSILSDAYTGMNKGGVPTTPAATAEMSPASTSTAQLAPSYASGYYDATMGAIRRPCYRAYPPCYYPGYYPPYPPYPTSYYPSCQMPYVPYVRPRMMGNAGGMRSVIAPGAFGGGRCGRPLIPLPGSGIPPRLPSHGSGLCRVMPRAATAYGIDSTTASIGINPGAAACTAGTGSDPDYDACGGGIHCSSSADCHDTAPTAWTDPLLRRPPCGGQTWPIDLYTTSYPDVAAMPRKPSVMEPGGGAQPSLSLHRCPHPYDWSYGLPDPQARIKLLPPAAQYQHHLHRYPRPEEDMRPLLQPPPPLSLPLQQQQLPMLGPSTLPACKSTRTEAAMEFHSLSSESDASARAQFAAHDNGDQVAGNGPISCTVGGGSGCAPGFRPYSADAMDPWCQEW